VAPSATLDIAYFLLRRPTLLSRLGMAQFLTSIVASLWGTTSKTFNLFLSAALLAGVLGFSIYHGIVPTVTAASPPMNAIQIENANAGDASWDQFASIAQQDAISGYGSSISVNRGSSIDFFVTTTSASLTIDIFRTGWYSGAGARKMASLGSFPGVHQTIPAPDPVTGMVACKWQKTTTLNVPSNWTTGVYLAKLTASSGNQSFIFFVVRNDGGTEAIDLQTSVTTYQAYNQYGGVSLYNNVSSAYKYPAATKVSFDRPFDPLDSNGAGHYLYAEYPFVRWAESQGYDLTYTTDVDTHTNVNPLTNHKAFLTVGHDEYWSKGMRNNVQNAINAGVSVAFFSANTMYWQIRFEPNAAGVPNRVEVGYKIFATSTAAPGPDPQWNVNNAIVTTRWRDDPVNLPENGLIGVMYQDQVDKDYAYVVQNASSWVYAGTGFINGTSIPGIVGYEYDKVWNNGQTPPGLTVLSNSPVVGCCEGSGNSFSNSSLYTAPSGARVFAAGTIQWSFGLDNYSAHYANAGMQRTTANILNNFISGGTTSAPAVSLSGSSVPFGNQMVGTTSGSQSVTLTNSGTAPLAISSITLGGTNPADFSSSNTCPLSPSTLAANANCSISATFTPTATGSRSAAISITDNAGGSPQTVTLNGTGIAPAVSLSSASLGFGNQTVSTTSGAQSVTLTNSGTAPLAISSITLGGTNPADFSSSNTCPLSPSTLAVNANCSISATFTPTATGSRSAAISITDNAGGSPQTLTLSGSGVTAAPAVSLSGSSVPFGNQMVGTTSGSQSVTLTNSGTAPLAISSITLGGTNPADFSSSNTCPLSPSTLAVNANCSISATFTPTATGSRSAAISITDNAGGSPQTLTLNGSGVAASTSLFSDGFESGSLPGAWTATSVTSPNTLSIDTTLKHSGSASLKAVQVLGSAGNAAVTKSIAGQTSLDVRAYYYLSSPVQWGWVELMSLYAQGQFIGWVTYNVDPTTPTMLIYNGANSTFYTCTQAPSLNAWHSIELQYTLSTTASGSFTLWIDGVNVCGATNVITSPAGGSSIDQVLVGMDSDDPNAGLTVHIDDVVVSKNYIGV
jgi:N,N-dimethylformamidase beta subunit-like protein/HYDIN/CFA65/VesB family protein/centrosomal CEP192-like protein